MKSDQIANDKLNASHASIRMVDSSVRMKGQNNWKRTIEWCVKIAWSNIQSRCSFLCPEWRSRRCLYSSWTCDRRFPTRMRLRLVLCAYFELIIPKPRLWYLHWRGYLWIRLEEALLSGRSNADARIYFRLHRRPDLNNHALVLLKVEGSSS